MRITIALAAAALLMCGCGEDKSPPLGPSGVARAHPIDSINKGEIAEGEEIAFGLRLPRSLRVKARMEDTVFAVGKIHLETAANYVRERVDAKVINTGPTKTHFKEAVPLRDKAFTVDVEVLVHREGVEIVVRDRTRQPAEKGLSDEERWRRAGLTPDGKVTKDQAE